MGEGIVLLSAEAHALLSILEQGVNGITERGGILPLRLSRPMLCQKVGHLMVAQEGGGVVKLQIASLFRRRLLFARPSPAILGLRGAPQGLQPFRAGLLLCFPVVGKFLPLYLGLLLLPDTFLSPLLPLRLIRLQLLPKLPAGLPFDVSSSGSFLALPAEGCGDVLLLRTRQRSGRGFLLRTQCGGGGS